MRKVNYNSTSTSVLSQEGGRERKSLKEHFYNAMIGTALCTLVLLGGEAINYFSNRNDMEVLKNNGCVLSEAVADKDFSYWGSADKAIDESCNAGKYVGVERLTDILRKENDKREIVVGEKYKVFDCACN